MKEVIHLKEKIERSLSLQYYHANSTLTLSGHIQNNLSQQLFSNFYFNEQPNSTEFMHIIASGSIPFTHPGHINFSGEDLPYYGFLTFLHGEGDLTTHTKKYHIASEHICFISYKELKTLEITKAPLTFHLILLDGALLSCYYKQLSEIEQPVLDLQDNLLLKKSVQELHHINSACNLVDRLCIHKQLTNVISDYLLSLINIQNNSTNLPPYLLSIKDLLDANYRHSYTLDELEAIFHKNKYQICREFTTYFHISPMKYLNQVRLDAAKTILVHENIPVHAVGTLVGIENTNHFIKLFKTYEGLTPLVYRQQNSNHPVSLS